MNPHTWSILLFFSVLFGNFIVHSSITSLYDSNVVIDGYSLYEELQSSKYTLVSTHLLFSLFAMDSFLQIH